VHGSQAWAVGSDLNDSYQTAGLLEAWEGTKWHVVSTPEPGSQRNLFYGVSAISASNVWVVGTRQDSDGVYRTLAEHWDGHAWSVVPTANSGSNCNFFYGKTATRNFLLGPQAGQQAPRCVACQASHTENRRSSADGSGLHWPWRCSSPGAG
jgi:hypothetical protein